MPRASAALAAAFWLAGSVAPDRALAFAAAKSGAESVVKIYVTTQRENYLMPWQAGPQASGTGTGFIISNKRILTNAHVVSDARFLEVQKAGDSRRYAATVKFVAHDCDLALLQIDDPSFFADTRPLRMADSLPQLNEEVIVLGYPLGGDRLSVTKGVVSRIDYATYAHSGLDQHLALQVDAAINPGNSGGPVLYDGRIVGLAFQGLAWAENIGYAIPLPVINHFLADVNDGHYHGYPELGVAYLNLRNAALRAELKLPGDRSGVVVCNVDPYGAGRGRLLPRDVLMALDGYRLDDDGTIRLDGDTVLFAELLERRQWGEAVTATLWRDGREVTVKIPLDNPPDPFVFRNSYDERPQYLIVGGLVFTTLSQELTRPLQRSSTDANVQRLFYLLDYVKIDRLHEDRKAFVVLSGRLPHPVNTYVEGYQFGVLEEVNGQPIRELRDLRTALSAPQGAFHRFRFMGSRDLLVLDVNAVRDSEREILTTYQIPARLYIEDGP